MCRPFILLNGLALCIWFVAVSSVTDWDFVILRIEQNTTNTDVFDFNLRSIRVSPGVYAVNGSISVVQDIDNTYSVDLKLYRSVSGSSQFRSTPFEYPTATFYKFMEAIYVKILQKDLIKCSNLPERENNSEDPFDKGIYVLNKCIITNEGMPGHMQPGIYKITAHSIGRNAELFVSIFIEIIAKSIL